MPAGSVARCLSWVHRAPRYREGPAILLAGPAAASLLRNLHDPAAGSEAGARRGEHSMKSFMKVALAVVMTTVLVAGPASAHDRIAKTNLSLQASKAKVNQGTKVTF